MATGTPDSQARFGQSVKGLLTEKVNTCGTDVIALTKQVLKGSRSSELLGQAARNMVLQEDAILHSEDSLRKMAIITTHLQYQYPFTWTSLPPHRPDDGNAFCNHKRK
ncbi:BLOC-1-related complex subunit 7 isoform 2-T2 [Callospermophilus lateralis]|uniref:BLOC-1-related complex subunit 7 isoform X2 n=1 Tax=Callospermophilus lateralis TaxID=76772 RepID=UPI004038EA85